MDAPGTVPVSINCHACGAVIDLTGQTGFTHIECPQCGAVSVVPVLFGNFLLLNTLGLGGVGTVYKAIDLSLNRYLALKILRTKLATGPDFIDNFSREARAAATVNHPNIAQVYSFGEHEGQYYLAMELLERGSLDDRISRLGKLPEKDVIAIGLQIASGLRAAQQRDLLHRDIKPGNILFNDDGVPKIVDFGLALAQIEAEQSAAALPEPVWGTPYYIAPEKLRGQTEDLRSDIYSLGASLFHALAGRPPFEAATAGEVAAKHTTTPAYSLKTYAPTLQNFTAHVIARMLAKEPGERYASYDELIHDLEEARAVIKAVETAPAIVTETGERFSIGSIVGTVVAFVVCGVVLSLVWINRARWFGLEPEPPRATTPAPSTRAEPAATGTAVESEEVNFNEETPWVKAWNVATLQLAQGKFTEALLAYDSARQLTRGKPVQRQWIAYFEGLTLVAADRPSESLASFLKATDLRGKPQVPDTITTGNFVSTLARMMLDGLPLADVEAALPRMPGWAAALTQLSAGFKHLESGAFDKAAESFRAYADMEPDETQRWAFNLQALGKKLASDCDSAQATLTQIDKLAGEQKFDEAMEKLAAAAKKTKTESLKAQLLKREEKLRTDTAQQRESLAAEQQKTVEQAREQHALEQQRTEEDAKAIQSLDGSLAAMWQAYDFNGVASRYRAVASQYQSGPGQRFLQQRLAAASMMSDFKTQLAADFSHRPYDGEDLQTRAQTKLSGRLVRATDTQVFFATRYGEVGIDWRDLPPATLTRLGEFYAADAAKTEKPDAQAQRYLRLAVFCRQFGLDRSVANYARRVVQLAPALQEQVDNLFPVQPSSEAGH